MTDLELKDAKILVVDDQEANIDVLTGFLEIQGYKQVKATTDAREVLSLFLTFGPDIILLDLGMPFLSGFEVMDEIKKHIPSSDFFPILVLTADVSFEAKQRALSNGASDFLTKPFDLIEVGLRIQNLLRTRFLHQQIENQNLLLEKKVKERTLELEKTNIELVAAKEKAEAGNKLKTAFLNCISHEIRTPLNGILGFGQLIAESNPSNEEKEEYLSILRTSSNRLVKTITDYLNISLLVSGNMSFQKQQFSPGRLAGEIYNEFKYSIDNQDISFSFQNSILSQNPVTKSDPELFKIALVHLLENAFKFTVKGSVILEVKDSGNDLEFSVADTGIGIEEEAQNIVFDFFMQANGSNTRIHDGSGLGLTIAKYIIELLGGKIWLKSRIGEGTVFYFTIPLQD